MFRRDFALANFSVRLLSLDGLGCDLGEHHFHFEPIVDLVPCPLVLGVLPRLSIVFRLSFVFRLSISGTSRIPFSIAVLSIPCYFNRWSLLSVERTANCSAIVCIQRLTFLISPHLNVLSTGCYSVVCGL